MENDRNALVDVKIKVLMLKFLEGRATFIQGTASIPVFLFKVNSVAQHSFTNSQF